MFSLHFSLFVVETKLCDLFLSGSFQTNTKTQQKHKFKN